MQRPGADSTGRKFRTIHSPTVVARNARASRCNARWGCRPPRGRKKRAKTAGCQGPGPLAVRGDAGGRSHRRGSWTQCALASEAKHSEPGVELGSRPRFAAAQLHRAGAFPAAGRAVAPRPLPASSADRAGPFKLPARTPDAHTARASPACPSTCMPLCPSSSRRSHLGDRMLSPPPAASAPRHTASPPASSAPPAAAQRWRRWMSL